MPCTDHPRIVARYRRANDVYEHTRDPAVRAMAAAKMLDIRRRFGLSHASAMGLTPSAS